MHGQAPTNMANQHHYNHEVRRGNWRYGVSEIIVPKMIKPCLPVQQPTNKEQNHGQAICGLSILESKELAAVLFFHQHEARWVG